MGELVFDLIFGCIWPDRDTFCVLACDCWVIFVVRWFLVDVEMLFGVYCKFVCDEFGMFLFELVEYGGVWLCYLIVGVCCLVMFMVVDG